MGWIRGIDVSRYQWGNGPIDWDKVKGAGFQFVIIKATEGTSYGYTDAYTENYRKAKHAGLTVGAYHFGHLSEGARPQAEYFHSIARLKPGDLRPVLDLESSEESSIEHKRNWTRSFVEDCKELFGALPFIYSYASFLSFLERNYNCPLWVAAYKNEPHVPSPNDSPGLPAAWKTWTIWQHTSKGTVPGINGAVDLDVFNGDKETFEQFLLAEPKAGKGAGTAAS